MPLVYVLLLFDMQHLVQLTVFVKYLSFRISRVRFLIVYYALETIVQAVRVSLALCRQHVSAAVGTVVLVCLSGQ